MVGKLKFLLGLGPGMSGIVRKDKKVVMGSVDRSPLAADHHKLGIS